VHIVYLHSDDYARLTGGFVYNSRLVASLRAAATLTGLSVPVAFPSIDEASRAHLAAAFAELPPEAVLLSDHLHVADLAPLLRAQQFRIVSVFHHSRTIEDRLNGVPADREAEMLGFDVCDAVIVTSDATRDYVVSHYAVEPSRIIVAVPGLDPAPRSAGPASGSRNLLTLGAVIPRKRQDYLVEVASKLRANGWHWRIVGDLGRDPAYVAALRERIAASGLAGRIDLAGGIGDDELAHLWPDTALCVAASHYEGYGMAVAEALRRGVPVVTTASGAVATWAGAGVRIALDDDAAAFAAILDGLLSEPEALRMLGDEAWAFGAALPTWDDTFAGMAGRISQAIGAPQPDFP
jgi:glycosyltransferase involved in cell wall biosynthesis